MEEQFIEVPLQGLSSEVSVNIVKALIKYILFDKGQIPCTFDELKIMVEEDEAENEGLRGGPLKKAIQFYRSVAQFFNELTPERFNETCIDSVEMMLGPSMVRPIEKFTIQISYDAATTSSTSSEGYEKRCIRAMISNMSASQSRRPTGVFFFLNATERVVATCFQSLALLQVRVSKQHRYVHTRIQVGSLESTMAVDRIVHRYKFNPNKNIQGFVL